MAVARAEAAWLAGDHAAVRAIAGPAYEEASRVGYARSGRAELLADQGGTGRAAACVRASYALQAAGRWREAAAAWQAAGCP